MNLIYRHESACIVKNINDLNKHTESKTLGKREEKMGKGIKDRIIPNEEIESSKSTGSFYREIKCSQSWSQSVSGIKLQL